MLPLFAEHGLQHGQAEHAAGKFAVSLSFRALHGCRAGRNLTSCLCGGVKAACGEALERGAAALVIEEAPPGLDRQGRPAVFVEDSRRALAPVACSFYGEPAHELTLIGVTGTNGKTSVTYLT